VDVAPFENGVKRVTYPSLLYRFSREKEVAYWNRQRRSYYQNYVRTIVNMLVSHATKQGVTRDGDELLMEFYKSVDQQRTQSIDDFMRSGLRWAQVEGIMWACVDVESPKEGGDGTPYVYWVSPLDILDWETDDDGNIVWLKQFVYVDAKRTFEEAVKPVYRFRIWYQDHVDTYQTNETGGDRKQLPTRQYDTGGKVPFVPLYSL